jgi:cell division septum initiation protein DivIVA
MSTSQGRDLPSSQKQLRAETAERLEAIVEAAERAAERVIDDAEAQARRSLAEAQAEAERLTDSRVGDVSDLVDSLVGQAVSLRREVDRLQRTLEAAQARLAGEESSPAPEPPAPVQSPQAEETVESQPPRLRAVTEQDGSQAAPAGEHDRAAGARLLATQLAVSGSSREEIAARLRTGFEIEDTSAILDAILGPEE